MSKRARQQGELESQVLDVLWASKRPLTSNEVLDSINQHDDLALTTVLTVLTRLMDKDLVQREPGEGRAFVFSATQTKAEYTAGLMLSLVAESKNPGLAFSHFASGLTASQLKALRESLKDR